jgi:hypothetical protein
LCLGPEDGDAAGILEETNAGLLAGFGDVKKMEAHVLRYYEEFKLGSLAVKSQHISKYSRKSLTQQLAAVLDEISSIAH